MSGFVATFPVGPSPAQAGSLARMSAQIAHRGSAEETLLVDGVPVASLRNTTHGAYRACAFACDDGVAIFEGMLWNEPDVIARFGGSDLAEALWLGYTRCGCGWLADLDGSFAIVFHDRRGGVFHLARDRFSARPLSYALLDDAVLIGSEIKALAAAAGFPPDVNRQVVAALFDVGFVPGPETLFARVYKALPGEVTTIRNRRDIETEVFHTAMPAVEAGRTSEDLGRFVGESLQRAITGYGRPETRLGVLLSGGIDSGLIAAALPAREGGGVHAVSFGDAGWNGDESGAAGAIAGRLGVPFTRAVVGEEFDPLAALEAAVWHIEEPTRFETSIALEVACAVVADTVDALATGESADMLFGSKDHFLAHWLLRLWRMPGAVRRALARTLRRGTSPWQARAGRYLDADSLAEYLLRSLGWAPPSRLGPVQPGLSARLDAFEERTASLAPHARITIMELVVASAPWVERMEQIGAAHGIDVVHPYARTEMLDYALSTPYRLKVARAGTRTKPALTQLARRTIGDEVADRPKQQFAAPFQKWLADSPRLRQAGLDLRDETSLWRRYADPGWIDPILQDFAVNGAADRRTSRVVLILLGLELWLRRFLSHPETHSAA